MTPRAIIGHLLSRGMPLNHALGVTANLKGESSFNPAAVGDQGTSFGLAQWHEDRGQAMKQFVGPNWAEDWRGQLDFLMAENPTQQYLAQDFSSPQDASRWFTINWERPANAKQKAEERLSFFRGNQMIQLPMSPMGQTTMQAPMSPIPAPPQYQAPTNMVDNPLFWANAAAGMAQGPVGNPFGALAMGLAAGQNAVHQNAQQQFANEMARYQAQHMTPYQQAQIQQGQQMTPYQRAQTQLQRERMAFEQQNLGYMTPYEEASLALKESGQQIQRDRLQMQQNEMFAKADMQAEENARRARAIRALTPLVGSQEEAEFLYDNAPREAGNLIAQSEQQASLSDVASLRNDFERKKVVTNYVAGVTEFDKLGQLLQGESSPYKAIATMYTFMRALDPESVVRETETNMFIGAGGPAETLASQMNKIMGQGMITPTAKRQLMRTAHLMMKGYFRQAKEQQDRYSKLAEEDYSANPVSVVGKPFVLPELPTWALGRSTEAPKDAIEKLPPGMTIIGGAL